MVYVIPLVCLVIPLIVSFIAMRKTMGWVPVVLVVMGALVMVWAILKGQQAQGWDGIGYGIVAVLMAAPAILGSLIGALIGWLRNRRAPADPS